MSIIQLAPWAFQTHSKQFWGVWWVPSSEVDEMLKLLQEQNTTPIHTLTEIEKATDDAWEVNRWKT